MLDAFDAGKQPDSLESGIDELRNQLSTEFNTEVALDRKGSRLFLKPSERSIILHLEQSEGVVNVLVEITPSKSLSTDELINSSEYMPHLFPDDVHDEEWYLRFATREAFRGKKSDSYHFSTILEGKDAMPRLAHQLKTIHDLLSKYSGGSNVRKIERIPLGTWLNPASRVKDFLAGRSPRSKRLHGKK